MYFTYLIRILQFYVFIKSLYGSYIAYSFLKWSCKNTYSGYLNILSTIYKPNDQIEDKYIHLKLMDDFLYVY